MVGGWVVGTVSAVASLGLVSPEVATRVSPEKLMTFFSHHRLSVRQFRSVTSIYFLLKN